MNIYMVIGCPGSGKTWVCEKLSNKFTWVRHDDYIGLGENAYVEAIVEAADSSLKPLLIEAPFSISSIVDPLKRFDFNIVPVFIQEDPQTIVDRYFSRENKEIPKGHLTRQKTYAERAKNWNAFVGSSLEVLNHLKGV